MSHINDIIEFNYENFSNRKERYDFLLKNFGEVVNSSSTILDVGCDDNYLKKIIGSKVFGIDIDGSPDKKVDLEKESLRFLDSNSKELVICLEVLEHLDNLHEVIDDLFRVSSKYVLISLPNVATFNRLWYIFWKKRVSKYYGLPLEKPRDRHKWFFTYDQVVNFMDAYTKKNNHKIERLMFHNNLNEYYNNKLTHKIKIFTLYRLSKFFNWKMFVEDIFVLVKKND